MPYSVATEYWTGLEINIERCETSSCPKDIDSYFKSEYSYTDERDEKEYLRGDIEYRIYNKDQEIINGITWSKARIIYTMGDEYEFYFLNDKDRIITIQKNVPEGNISEAYSHVLNTFRVIK